MEIEKDTYTSKYYIPLTNFAMNVYGPKERGGGEMVRVGKGWGGVKGRRGEGGKRAFNTFAFAICKTHFGESSSVHHSTILSTDSRMYFRKRNRFFRLTLSQRVFLEKNVDFSSSPRLHLICKSVYTYFQA